MVNLEWYRTFKAVYENGTLTKAASALYSSQPGVSLHLNTLEAYVGRKLFTRTSRKMIPTEEGTLLYNNVADALSKLEAAEQHFKKTSSQNKPTLHVGMCSETFQLVLEPEIPHFTFDLVAEFGSQPALYKGLDEGLLDLVVTSQQKEGKKSTLHYKAFSKEKIVLIAGKNTDTSHITAHIETQNWEALEKALRGEKWYSASNEKAHFRAFWFNNFKKRQDFKPNFILPNISSIVRCLCDSNGYAVIPDFLCSRAIANQEVKLVWEGKVPTENTLFFGWRSRMQHPEEVAKIQQVFSQKMIAASSLNPM